MEEEYKEPTGWKEIKKGGQAYYQYVYDSDEGRRFVNSNKRCVGCLEMSKCYRGRHAIIMACQEKVTE